MPTKHNPTTTTVHELVRIDTGVKLVEHDTHLDPFDADMETGKFCRWLISKIQVVSQKECHSIKSSQLDESGKLKYQLVAM